MNIQTLAVDFDVSIDNSLDPKSFHPKKYSARNEINPLQYTSRIKSGGFLEWILIQKARLGLETRSNFTCYPPGN